jgi:hypothetical protein
MRAAIPASEPVAIFLKTDIMPENPVPERRVSEDVYLKTWVRE